MLHINFSSFPLLPAYRLTIRPLRAEDATAIYTIRNFESVNQYIDRNPPASVEVVETFITKMNQAAAENKNIVWSLELKESNEVIGTLCLWNIEEEKLQAEIGYELHPAHQRRGYTYEAIQALMHYAFTEVGLQILTAVIHRENKASIALAEKCGFVLDSTVEFKEEPHLTCYKFTRST